MQKRLKSGMSLDNVISLVELTSRQMHARDGRRSVDEWRAIILCVMDRWGIGKARISLQQIGIYAAAQEAHALNKRLRVRLASRCDNSRVQAQRVLKGPSLLCVTRSKSLAYNMSFSRLIATVIHPEYGIDGYKVEDVRRVPQMLPHSLQPDMPVLPSRCVTCHKINNLLSAVYGSNTEIASPAVTTFVKRYDLDAQTGKDAFGLPSHFDVSEHGFISEMPDVQEGDVILWNTWHATGGAAKCERGAKLVAFLDMVPIDFLGADLYRWYTYVAANAPVDPGAGSSRGAWLSLQSMITSGKKDQFGLDTTTWPKVGESILSDDDRWMLQNRGYLIVRPPVELRDLSTKSTLNFEAFFRNVSGYPLDTSIRDGYGSVTSLFEAGMGVIGSDMVDRQNPLRLTGLQKSRNAQGGGAMITKGAGMGAGTTLCNEEFHVAFQTSQYLANLMASAGGDFYARPLIPVLERFRLKDLSKWEKATHVDSLIERMIPDSVREAVVTLTDQDV